MGCNTGSDSESASETPSDCASDAGELIISGVFAAEYKGNTSRSTSGEPHVRRLEDEDNGELHAVDVDANGDAGLYAHSYGATETDLDRTLA